MKRTKAMVLGLAVTGLAATAGAVNIQSTVASTIDSVDTYTSYGDGDAVVHLVSNSLSSACPYGFWISGMDKGGKSALAQIIAAHKVGSQVIITADTDSIWPGNGNTAACKVWSVTGK